MNEKMRVYHRYLGYFLAGIMSMYAISGIILIFRDTEFLKSEKQMERTLAPGLKPEEVGRELRIRELKVESETETTITFPQGTYDKVSGNAVYKVKELPFFVDKMTKLHKANTKSPLFFLNIFFGLSLLFFVLSAFWMFLPRTSVFKKGLYAAAAGAILTLVLILI